MTPEVWLILGDGRSVELRHEGGGTFLVVLRDRSRKSSFAVAKSFALAFEMALQDWVEEEP